MKTAYKPVVKLAAAAAAAFFAVSSIQVPVTALAYTKPAGSHVLTPIASGVTTYSNEKATLDASNVSEGYIMVKYTGSVGKIKVQITKSGSETYTYDLSSSGVYEVFPLSEGSGSYSVKVFENIQGNQYSQAFSQNVCHYNQPVRTIPVPQPVCEFQCCQRSGADRRIRGCQRNGPVGSGVQRI